MSRQIEPRASFDSCNMGEPLAVLIGERIAPTGGLLPPQFPHPHSPTCCGFPITGEAL